MLTCLHAVIHACIPDLFDVFDTMSGLYKSREFTGIFGRVEANSVGAIQESFRKVGLLDERVAFHPGLFSRTTQDYRVQQDALLSGPRPIAVLRVDGNFASSYEDALYNLYELVPVGGIVIFDDYYDHPEVRSFWGSFRRD